MHACSRGLFVQRRKRAGTGAHQSGGGPDEKDRARGGARQSDVDTHTHANITTGTYETKVWHRIRKNEGVYARAAKLKNLRLRGLQTHIGSQLTSVKPFEEAVRKLLPLVKRLLWSGTSSNFFCCIGGGLGIVYHPALASASPAWWQSAKGKKILTPDMYAARMVPLLPPPGMRILLEPGRFISGNAGILVTRIEYVKQTGRKKIFSSWTLR